MRQGCHNLKWFILLCFFIGLNVYAQDDDAVQILEISSTKKTISVNKGVHDGIIPGMKSIIVIADIEKQLHKIGKAEAVKSFPGQSIWYFHDESGEGLVKGQTVFLKNESYFYASGVEVKVKRERVIGPRRSVEEILAKKGKDQKPERLKFKDQNYSKKIMVEHSDWTKRENFDGEHQMNEEVVSKNITNDQFQTAFKDKRYDDLIEGDIAKANDKSIQIDDLHKPQKIVSDESTYREIINRRKERKKIAGEVISEKAQRGEDWSDDMSDEELFSFVKDLGIEHERGRRDHFIARQHPFEITASLGLKLNNTVTGSDTTYANQTKRDYVLGLEYYLSGFGKDYDHFSVEAEIKSGTNVVTVTETKSNASISDKTYALNAYWYPFYFPQTLKETLIFVGTGIRRGAANVSVPGADSIYSVTGFPSMIGGIRYHFYDHLGIRAMGILEKLSMSYSSSSSSTVTSASVINYWDFRILGGISYYF